MPERCNIPEHSAAVKVHFTVIAVEEPELCSDVNSPNVDPEENGSFSPSHQCLRAHKPHTTDLG